MEANRLSLLEVGLCSPEQAMAMRMLVVEDDKKIASFVVKGLKQSGFAVDHCSDGESGLVLARTTPYDAAVIDIMLPKLDGLSLVQQLRREHVRTPVIILSAKASVDDRVKGLQAGGDDYLTKPFAFWPGCKP
jgi:two-component system OmpR family response regulator